MGMVVFVCHIVSMAVEIVHIMVMVVMIEDDIEITGADAGFINIFDFY